jgi:rod shape determining protein RodA
MFGINKRYLSDFDWLLFSVAVAVAAFGILEISNSEPSPGLWRRQLVGLGIGLGVLFVTTKVDYEDIVKAARYLYGVGVVLLLLVLTPLGEVVNGNKSWLDLGFVKFQPSEVAKLFTLLFLAGYLAEAPDRIRRNRPASTSRSYLAGARKSPLDLWTILVAVAIWAVPTGLVFAQNDTGSALSFTSFLVATLFLAGMRWSWVVTGLLAVVLAIFVSAPYVKECKSYKCERVKAVFWPELAEKRFRYQNDQAEIAVGSGGVVGKWFKGGNTQGTGGFLPEVHNDFIFAVAGEDWGFIGSSLLLIAYLVMIARLLRIARRSPERSGLLLVGGFAALLLYHVAVNIGMVVRLLPIMGIPLPLMSFGSTSVIATCFGLGLAISVRLKRFVN